MPLPDYISSHDIEQVRHPEGPISGQALFTLFSEVSSAPSLLIYQNPPMPGFVIWPEGGGLRALLRSRDGSIADSISSVSGSVLFFK